MSNYVCPTCQSTGITKLALVIAKSTRTFGIGTLGFGFRRGAYTAGSIGASANQIAQQFPPPAPKSYHLFLLTFALIGAVVEHKGHEEGIATIALIVLLVLLVRAIWYNYKVYPAVAAQWERLFLCNRCGSVFEIAPAEPVSETQPAPQKAKVLKLIKGGKEEN